MPEGDYVRPDVRQFLDYMNTLAGPPAHEIGHVVARAQMRAARDLADLDVGELAVLRDLEAPGPDGRPIGLRLYDPRADRMPGPVMVYYHGGGFVVGDLDTHEPVCAEIARVLDMPVVSVDYRLAPEHPWPAAPDDAETAARWVAANGHAIGRSATGLVLAGDSAGGMLAIVAALALRDEPAALPVLATWLVYPATDLETRRDSYRHYGVGYMLTRDALRWFVDSYAPDLGHWRGAPMSLDLSGFPATLVTTASLDPLRDQGRAFAAALIAAGVPTIFREAKGMIHGFLNLRRAIPSAQGDLMGDLAALKPLIVEAEAGAAMRQAAAVAVAA
jgi:acetyl esterase